MTASGKKNTRPAKSAASKTGNNVPSKSKTENTIEFSNLNNGMVGLDTAMLLNNLPEQVILWGPDRNMVWANKAAGPTLESGQITECHARWIGRDTPCPDCPVKNAFETGQPQQGRIESADRQYFVCRAYPLKNEQGDMVGVAEFLVNVTDKELAERALKEREQDYQALFDHAPIGVFRLNSAGNFLAVNPALARMFGYETPADFLKNITRDSEDKVFGYVDDNLSVVDAVLQQRRLMNHEHRFHRQDGNAFWGNVNMQTAQNPDGSAKYLEGFIEDITERKLAEEALRESEEKYRTLFQNVQVGMFRSRLKDGLSLEANNRMAQIFGFKDRSEMVNQVAISEYYVDPDDRDKMLGILKSEGVVNNFETRLRRRDGEIIWVRYTARTYPDRDYMEGVLTDITERKMAESELRASEERYRTLADNVAEAVVLVQDEQVRLANAAFADMFGFADAAEAMDTAMADLVRNDARSQFDLQMQLLGNDIRGRMTNEWPGVRQDGSQLWVGAWYSGIEWKGRPALLITLRDVTEQKRKEQEFENEVERLRTENIRLRRSVSDRYRLGDIIGKSHPMQTVYELILKAAATDAHVIIYGESGTGKDLAAQAIHKISDRRDAAFVPVNCGAIPENLLESEFFGHKKGAFTGAQFDKHGYLDLADNGTLFLDEVGELGLNLQVKLLRAIEGAGYTPVGGHEVKKPKIRVIAATNRDLVDEVRSGRMREDFFYRIHVIPITLPPLRERKDDIPLLVEHFLKNADLDGEVGALPANVLETLFRYDWPGNVRELQNVLHRYLAIGRLDFLAASDTPPGQAEVPLAPDITRDSPHLKTALERFERQYIISLLDTHHWNRSRVAGLLGISRRTLFRKMKTLGID
jgi:PAS domain S-box-containing protein